MINCPNCNSVMVGKNGFGHDKVQHYICKECKTDFVPIIENGARVIWVFIVHLSFVLLLLMLIYTLYCGRLVHILIFLLILHQLF